ncbi:MFS transporter [Thermostaphylospora chromogena]|uniref:MFS transporter, DHA2 family, multidrug resistance protein n=1 Tax=Thermostaphylospora chromogena TaxID=35622 RepID=A0A1H1CD97_9ACTN|nr:MFS transporter [Thermostaphylospora chromogena]SDQ62092.1 MFS transporter, DHA2 family, multidrug resistance protein [Thermostaphylospora chromogena]
MNQAGGGRAGAREWGGLGLLALPTLLLGMDVTVLYLVLPSLAADVRPSATQTLWIMDAYGFLIAGFLITMGNLGDRIGRRRLLMIGAAGFALASVLAAFSSSAWMLIAARALLGVAGATLMPSTLALISNMFVDLRQRALAIGVWATMFALGMAAGPVIGGMLLARFWWGAAFLIAVPVVAVLLVAAPFMLPEYRAPREGGFDLPSVVLSLAAILPIIFAIKHAAADGFDATVLGAAAVGAGCSVLFVRRQRALPAPLLDVTLFTSRAFTAALCILLIGLVGVGGVMFLITQYLQLVEGLSATVAGLWMGPPALAMLAAAIGAPLIARRVRPATVMTTTLVISLIGYGLLATTGPGRPSSVVVAFAFVYLGLGAIAALGTDIVVGAAPPTKAGSAAAMSETVQELGIAVGVAVLGSLTTALYRSRVAVPTTLPPEIADRVGDSLSAVLTVTDEVPVETVEHAKAVFTSGLNAAALVAGLGVGAVAVVCAITLRHIRPITGSTA